MRSASGGGMEGERGERGEEGKREGERDGWRRGAELKECP